LIIRRFLKFPDVHAHMLLTRTHAKMHTNTDKLAYTQSHARAHTHTYALFFSQREREKGRDKHTHT